MGNVNMEAYQIHYKGNESVADHLRKLDIDVEKTAVLPDLPTTEGKTVLTAVTDDQGDTELTYEAPEVEGEDIAPAFSEEVTYPAGTLVYYEGILYKFTSDHTAGAWDTSEVTQTSAAAEFVETNAAVNELKNTLTARYVQFTPESGVAITVGTIYKCSNILLGTLWIDVPSTRLSAFSELGSFNITLVNQFRTIGVAMTSSISGRIGHFIVNSSGKLLVDNNYALPGAGEYKLDITVPLA